ncbi:MAG: 6,7-dimethyl-8-ribityllumazine synthase [Proteobacteria bacterium]|nr:6,7-dimethyl-8-ribityllumazine synthase [Pseudomonadota bacterium]
MPAKASPRFAFIKANWHADIVGQGLVGFRQHLEAEAGEVAIDVFDVPGALEIPLLAKHLAGSGKYAAVVGCAFVVDGGIYRHEFVSASVIDGIMQAQLATGVPILSVVLTPQSTPGDPKRIQFFKDHFVIKGKEAAVAALAIADLYAKHGINR